MVEQKFFYITKYASILMKESVSASSILKTDADVWYKTLKIFPDITRLFIGSESL